MTNKNHWYDGVFYDKVIAPNQDRAFEAVKEIISHESAILDVGCGTGRMAFRLWDRFRKYTGIDLSKRNINTAKKKLCPLLAEKIEYIHTDAYSYLKGSDMKFDYAVLSYVIHEMNEGERVPLLKFLAGYTYNIILIDYLVPRRGGFTDKVNGIVEFMAGREHYRNFKSYVFKGGLRGLAEQSGLNITKEITDIPETAHITVLK